MIADHLWQSTWFGLAVAGVTLPFRSNRARVRFWLWLAASVKFLIPFAPLIALGTHFEFRTREVPREPARQAKIVIQASEPFTYVAAQSPIPTGPDWTQRAIAAVWICGFLTILVLRFRGWRRVQAALRMSRPVDIPAAVEVRSSPGLLEPGVVGWIRPVLLIPQNIEERLSPAQLAAVLAHELCHVRRRDNLTAAVHMIVEALFWFHPMVWWIGARLIDERERACDEEVLKMGNQPEEYAEGIVNVCKSYLESPVRCVAGVTGSDLKKRINAILSGSIARELSFAKRIALTAAGVAGISAPIAVGVMNAPLIRAQSQAAPKFEVASIKLCSPDTPMGRRGNGPPRYSPGTLNINCVTAERLIENAYDHLATGKPRFHGGPVPIEGLPGWAKSERYVIDAKSEGHEGRGVMQGPMMQKLLEDRFNLKLRRVPREVDVYWLTVAKGGPKLTPSKEGSCIPFDFDKELPPPPKPGDPEQWLCGLIARGTPQGTGMAFVDVRAVNVTTFADNLSVLLDREVIDKTGISGTFDIHVDFPLEELPAEWSEPADPAGPHRRVDESPLAFAAVRRLGLKLESAKGVGEKLVIDHIERPSEN